ncbi:MAG: hypothetical protein JRH07_10480 [Deltaproteobacteria bacterium]|nr:hypothetical protein [Deltaproteobacteria bacterium]MBW2122258.1 hypothetical protein [Deltaproteobacteria bacterium]
MGHLGLILPLSVLALLCVGSGALERNDSPPGRVCMAVFYSGRSDESSGLVEGFLPVLEEVYPIDVRLFDVDIPRNYSLLVALERRFGREESGLPVVFLGRDVIAGEEEIRERLESTIARYEALGGCGFPDLSKGAEQIKQRLGPPVYLIYFYRRGCAECRRVDSLIRYLKEVHPGLVVREVDIETDQGTLLNESMSERVGVPEASRLVAPSVFFARDALVGEKIGRTAMEDLIEKYQGLQPAVPPWGLVDGEKDEAVLRITARFKSFGLVTVMAAGLIDGVNPCAFAALILFVSYLAFVGRERREILLVGLAYSLAVFGTYFLIGLGFLRIIRSVSVLPTAGRLLYLGVIGLAFVFALLSLYDYLLCRKGRASEMVLQMPAFLKSRVRAVIRQKVRVSRYVLAAVVTGFLVSVLELACTGQVYLPTILFVSRAGELRSNAAVYLALYNVMFIIPLLAVFCLVYSGTGSERLSALFERHVSWVKLATSLVFFALVGVLSLGLLWPL